MSYLLSALYDVVAHKAPNPRPSHFHTCKGQCQVAFDRVAHSILNEGIRCCGGIAVIIRAGVRGHSVQFSPGGSRTPHSESQDPAHLLLMSSEGI